MNSYNASFCQCDERLRELLLKGDYQRVYLDLNAAAEREAASSRKTSLLDAHAAQTTARP